MKRRIRKIHVNAFGMTDKGKVRDANEDNFVVDIREGFFAVADGMGGHARGEVASQTAVETCRQVLSDVFAAPGEEDTMSEDDFSAGDEEKMKLLMRKANRAIFSKNREGQKEKGAQDLRSKMGTTFVCLKILGQKMYIANTGDSRCYLLRKKSFLQLTEDHSKEDEILQTGRLTEAETRLKKIGHYITNCLGTRPVVDPDVVVALPKKGDKYLLCSDGLSKMLSDEKIGSLLESEKDIRKACQKLITLANEMGGKDNITAVILEVTGVELTTAENIQKGAGEFNPEETFQ